MLEISSLKVHYSEAIILRGISFQVKRGEIVTLIGSNGAGKTTLLRTIAGLKKSTAGEIRFNNKRIDHLPPEDIIRCGIGFVTQTRNLFPYMTVRENIKLGAYLRSNKEEIVSDLEKSFQLFPALGSRKRQLARTLSGGEQQMLAIARALMGGPGFLLLDEPSTGVAPLVLRTISKVILDINQRGTSILLVEQNARMALKLATRGYVLETGSIVLEGSGKELLNDERVQKAYLGQ